MVAVPHNPSERRRLPQDMRLFAEHLLEDERFAWLLAWVVLLLTLAFFATAPVY